MGRIQIVTSAKHALQPPLSLSPFPFWPQLSIIDPDPQNLNKTQFFLNPNPYHALWSEFPSASLQTSSNTIPTFMLHTHHTPKRANLQKHYFFLHRSNAVNHNQPYLSINIQPPASAQNWPVPTLHYLSPPKLIMLWIRKSKRTHYSMKSYYMHLINLQRIQNQSVGQTCMLVK